MVALLVAALVVGQLITAGVDEYYSPGFHSASTAHARERGVLLAPVVVGDSVLRWRGREYRVREAWVEDQQQVYYRALFFRRDSLLHRPTLVVRVEGAMPHLPDGDALCVALGRATLLANGSTPLVGNDCRQWYGSVRPPFPSSVALSVKEPAAASH